MKTRSAKAWIIGGFGVIVVVSAAVAFGYKLNQFARTLLQGEVPGFAVVPITTYLIVAAGFGLLLVWSFLKGHFKDMEAPKYRMLEREQELERQELLAERSAFSTKGR